MSMTTTGPTIKRGQSSGDIWTPMSFIRVCEAKFGPLVVDLAASNESAKAPIYIDVETNSLRQNWSLWARGGLSWLNPPYDDITSWAKKCAYEQQRWWRGLLLVPGSIGANWYWDFVEPYANVYSIGRLVFDNAFDKHGELITTPYPKDLILCHYDRRVTRSRMQRWYWNA